MFEAQESFVKKLVSEVNGAWESIKADYERFTWKDEPMEVYRVESFVGTSAVRLHPSIEALDLLRNLQIAMKKEETWTSCSVSINSSGKYNFDFSYGMPPMIEKTLKLRGEIQ